MIISDKSEIGFGDKYMQQQLLVDMFYENLHE